MIWSKLSGLAVLAGCLGVPALADGGVTIPAGQGVTIKQRHVPSKAKQGDQCPAANPNVEISPREAVNEASIRDWAGQGSIRYQAALGAMLLEGRLTQRDPQEANFWLECAAAAGNVAAGFNLAMQLYHGDGVPVDLARAFRLIRPAADAGDVNAQHLLGNMYSLGQGTAKDAGQAVLWHTKAAEQGDVAVQAALGYRYLIGDGVAKDMAKAIKWMKLAAEGGDADSRSNLEIAQCIIDKRCDSAGKPVGAAKLKGGAKKMGGKIAVRAQWLVGQTASYAVDKSTARRGEPAQKVHYDLTVKVLAANKQGYVLELSVPQAMPRDEFDDLFGSHTNARIAGKAPAPLVFNVTTDKDGVFVVLNNWQVVAKAVIDTWSAAGTPRADLERLFSSEEATRQTLLRDLDFFQRPLGLEFPPDTATTVDGRLPTALFGDLIVHDRYELKPGQPDAGMLTATSERTFDEKSLSAAIGDYLKRQKGPALDANQMLSAFKLRDSSLYRIDVANGWVKSGWQRRVSGANEDVASQVIDLKFERQ
jgi:TPR repeat protein